MKTDIAPPSVSSAPRRTPRSRLTLAVGLVAAAVVVGGVIFLVRQSEPGFQERLLATLPASSDLNRIAFRPDGGEASYISHDQSGQLVVMGNTRGPVFEEIGLLQYPPTGIGPVYTARKGQEWTLFVRDKPVGTATKFERLQFNPTTGEPFYITQTANQFRLEHPGQSGPLVDEIGEVAVAPGTSGRFAYAARVGAEWRVIEGEHRGEAWDAVSALSGNPSGDVLAYVAREWGAHYVIVGESSLGPFDGVGGSIGFAADGKSVAYVADNDDHMRLFEANTVVADVDGQIIPVFTRAGLLVARLEKPQTGSTSLKIGSRTVQVDADLSDVSPSSDGVQVTYAVRGPEARALRSMESFRTLRPTSFQFLRSPGRRRSTQRRLGRSSFSLRTTLRGPSGFSRR